MQASLDEFAALRVMGFTLYTREVSLQGGRVQRIFFFSRERPADGVPCEMPDGFELVTTAKGPILRQFRGVCRA